MLLGALLVSINITLKRYQFENRSNRVEMAVSYNEMEQLSVLGGINSATLFKRLRDEAKITSVAIEEDTIEDFVERGKVTVLKGSEIMNMYRVGHVNRFLLTHLYKQIKVKPNCFYLIIEERGDYERISDFLTVEFGKDNVKRVGRVNILEVIDSREDLMNLRVGISKDKIAMVKSLGLRPIIRLSNSNRLNKYVIKQKLLSFVNETTRPIMIFEGETALGYPNHVAIVQEALQDYNIHLGFVEFTKRVVEKQLAAALPELVIRVHTIPEKEMISLSREQAVQRYVRAARERSIKILFIRPFFQGYHEESMIDFNIQFIKNIGLRLQAHHKSLGQLNTADSTSYQPTQNWELMILSLGVLTVILFLVNFFINLRMINFLIINILFLSCFSLAVIFQHQTKWGQIMALVTAIIVPAFAMISQFPLRVEPVEGMRKIYQMITYILSVVGITLVGCFLIVGFLSDIRFIEGVSRFVGVKAAFVGPLLIVGVFYYFKPHRISSLLYILRRGFQSPINMASIIAILFTLFFVILLLLRSGNYIAMPQFTLEEKFRALLENTLFVRPRTKEFLIGYPFLLFSFYGIDRFISRRWIWLFNGIGLVALISMINSFCHIHTPLAISIYRTCMGIVIGTLLGVIYIGMFHLFYKFGKRLLK
jgi:hypothetical protein